MKDDAVTSVAPDEAVRAFARIGFLSFGGPAAQIAVMHKVLVDEKRWMSEEEFLSGLNFCMLLPGPEAMQLATYAGWRIDGVRGGVIAGLLFILPGLAMMLALSAVFVAYGDVPLLAGVFFGLKAAVIAVVLQALLKVSGKALQSYVAYVVAVAAFIAIYFLRIPFPVVIVCAAIFGVLAFKPKPTGDVPPSMQPSTALRQTLRACVVWGGLWLVPLAILVATGGFARDAALFFSQTAVVTFGGAYAVLAYVGQQAVETYGWLSTADMLKGLGLAETTLGPLVLVLVFVGFLGGSSATAEVSLIGGLGGGLLAAFFTFAPCFLWIFAAAPHIERLRSIRWISAALSAITAAVVGVIANLAVWFALAVFFNDPTYAKHGLVWLPEIDIAQVDWLAALIAIAATVAMLRFKVGMMPVLAAAAIVGLAAQGLVG